ncbi:hypothetical protein QJS10_CPA01g00058 [Acorus calamus]|uniref:Uncharacterized protein n=1 Tax=Acorus calamus TaxID=4465 RepID=A0AAV9FIV5_ACOCL|nr:hypothetical protein QJS10_CPA01g00058 [Acorus calamus]
MKLTSQLVFPSLLLLLITTISSSTVADAASASETVRDINGEKLRPDVNYYIMPAPAYGVGGGLTLAAHKTNWCPLNVAQQALSTVEGLPLTFSPVNRTDKTIQLSTDTNIKFSDATICVQSTVWKLGDLDELSGRRFVTSGGVRGSPGVGSVGNWFKIERYGGDGGYNYKPVFCPSVCSFCKVICGDVGVFVENGKRWLVLASDGDVPFIVVFKKATEA